MPINFDTAFGIHDDAMMLHGRRAGILAANLANADTPNYKARDMDFKAVLGRVSGTQGSTAVTTTHPRHLTSDGAGVSGGELKYRVPHQPSLDGNTVDTDIEQSAFMENGLRYQASLRFLGGRIKTLMTAIRGS